MTEAVTIKQFVRVQAETIDRGRLVSPHFTLELRQYPHSQSVEITWIKTMPAKQGIGRIVIEELQDYCADTGRQLVASYPTAKAIGFYKHLGFVEMGKHLVWSPARIT